MKGHLLCNMTLEQCEKLINEDTIIVLPIGSKSKQHGHHLPLGTDYYVADWLAKNVAERMEGVVVLPTLPYAYFAAHVSFVGTVSLTEEHFVNMVQDIIMSYVRFGVWKFLIIDNGVSTFYGTVVLARNLNNSHNIKIGVTNCRELGREADAAVCEQKAGGHACEAETSTMLYVNEGLVHMDRATEEYSKIYPLSSKVVLEQRVGTVTGVNGNSKLATKEKGRKMMHAKLDDILLFLEAFKKYTKSDIE